MFRLVSQLLMPMCLILLGFLIYYLNRDPNVHIGFRGMPWLDVPSFFVGLGVLFIVIKLLLRRLRLERTLKKSEEDPEDSTSSGEA